MRDLIASGARMVNGKGFYDYTPEEVERWRKLLIENVWRVRDDQRPTRPRRQTEGWRVKQWACFSS